MINLDDVKEKVANILKSLDREVIVSLANWKYFTVPLSLATFENWYQLLLEP